MVEWAISRKKLRYFLSFCDHSIGVTSLLLDHSITISRLKTISASSLPVEVLMLVCWGKESLRANLAGKSFSQRDSSVLIGVPGLFQKELLLKCF